MKTFFAQ